MRPLLISIAAIVLIAGGGCDVGDSCKPVCDPCGTGRIIMFDDPRAITVHTDGLSILDADVVGNTLQLRVLYGGGCRDHDFKLYGASGFMESLPVQAALFLSHDANDDPCDALVFQDLAFDLLPLRETYLRGYRGNGPIVLRLLGPGSQEPYEPRPVYEFCR